MSERDPRWEPNVGDELRDGFGRVAMVTHRTGDYVRRKVDGEPTTVTLPYWRDWYRDATIIRRGDE